VPWKTLTITRLSKPPSLDYEAQSAVERELVLRLAGLLWRLRRATTMETGLFEIQANHLKEFRQARQALSPCGDVIYTLVGRVDSASYNRNPAPRDSANTTAAVPSSELNPIAPAVDSTVELTRCFLRCQPAQLRAGSPEPL
jgi:hypothetical protein